MDGRDTDPKSGLGFIRELKAHMDKSTGRIASVIGRYYAMDRDNRWERVKEAYDLIVNGIGTPTQHVEVSIQRLMTKGLPTNLSNRSYIRKRPSACGCDRTG